jgi:uncharacterized protein (DUF697 family)
MKVLLGFALIAGGVAFGLYMGNVALGVLAFVLAGFGGYITGMLASRW